MGGPRWSDDEIRFLKENYGELTAYEIAEKLEKRGARAVYTKACELGITYEKEEWDEEEERFLRENIGEMTDLEIAERLGRLPTHVTDKRQELGLHRDNTGGEHWSEDELSFLREHYREKSAFEIGRELGRTMRSVRAKASKLGITSEER